MIRGTTPTLEFALPFEVDLIAEAYVTISQNQSVVIDKSLSELTCAGKTLTVTIRFIWWIFISDKRHLNCVKLWWSQLQKRN